jgi:hypothetical protein
MIDFDTPKVYDTLCQEDMTKEVVMENYTMEDKEHGLSGHEEDGDCYCCIASYPHSYLENVADFVDDEIVALCRDCATEWRRTAVC